MQSLFTEKQKFPSWLYWLIASVAILPMCILLAQVVGGKSIGDKPMSNLGLIIWIIVSLVFVWLFLKMELITSIDSEKLKIKFFPFANKEVRWEEVSNAEVLNYGFIGGWGVRLTSKYGTVYNTNGKIGLALELKNGKKMCIGTQREGELNEVMKNVKTQYDF